MEIFQQKGHLMMSLTNRLCYLKNIQSKNDSTLLYPVSTFFFLLVHTPYSFSIFLHHCI
jgi:hypothetical protein